MHPLVERLTEFMNLRKVNTRKLSIELGYESPEKLYRLFRDKNAKPSIDIVEDISNKFDELNIEWLLTGKGEMIKKTPFKYGNIPPSNSTLNENSVPYSVISPPQDEAFVTDFVTPTVTPPAKNNLKQPLNASSKSVNLPLPSHGWEGNYNLGAPKIITINENREENIIYVPVKARAGYLSGYGDPEFMQTLPTLRIPGLNKATYRMFETEGPSMAPGIISGDRIIAQWVGSLNEIRENRVHIIVTANNGIVIKRVLNRIDQRGKLVLKSDTINHRAEYPSYEIEPSEIMEIWYARLKLSSDFSEPSEVYHRLADLEADMVEVKQILGTLIK